MTNSIPVLEAIEGFLRFCSARGDSVNTVRSYRSDLTAFANRIGKETRTAMLNRKHVRFFLFSLDAALNRNTVRRKLAAIKSFGKWLMLENYLEVNPAEGVTGPRKHSDLPCVPGEAEMSKLLDGEIPTSFPQRDRLILELLYSGGLRASEVAGLNLDDLRNDNTILIRGKGRKERLVPIGRAAQTAIAAWIPMLKKLTAKKDADKAALLLTRKRERIDVRTIRRVLEQVALAKELPRYHPHLLRHACATHMHNAGAPIQAIAAMLGHSKLATAQIYTQVSPARMLGVYANCHPHAKAVQI